MSDGQLAWVRPASYTENEAAESVAGVALDLLTKLHVDATSLGFPVVPPLARR